MRALPRGGSNTARGAMPQPRSAFGSPAISTTNVTPFVRVPGVIKLRNGEYTSIAVGSDGVPVISFYNASLKRLNVAACVTSACLAAVVATDSTVPARVSRNVTPSTASPNLIAIATKP